MQNLMTKQIYANPPQQTQVAIPIQFVKPLSYEFRVAEIIQDGKISAVKLQMQTYEHDEYGVATLKQYWMDVPRVQMDANGNFL